MQTAFSRILGYAGVVAASVVIRIPPGMPAFLHRIATQTPSHAYAQETTRERLKSWAPDRKTQRLIHAIYNRSGIETRHSVLPDFDEHGQAELYRDDPDGAITSPGTAARNAVYARESRKLAVSAARRVIEESADFEARDITHVVFASCTGFANPGPDFHIIRELGLSESVQRYTLGFMGCYAAFPALRMAAQFCEADPKAVVLVVCLELCTLHMQVSDQPDSILANSLFADGVAAALVSCRLPPLGQSAFRLDGFESALLTDGEADMAWDIGDEGFQIVLSSYVPGVIGANIHRLLEEVLGRAGLQWDDVEQWAVHPGGRSILDKVESSLGLAPEALQTSRDVLRRFGNMSSATILFVLDEMLASGSDSGGTTCALAFGPGLTVETAMLTRVGARSGSATVSEASAEPVIS